MNIAAARARPRAPIRLGRLVFDLSDHRLLAADAAVVAAVLSVVGLFAISPVTLEAHGVAYLTSGGGLLSKSIPRRCSRSPRSDCAVCRAAGLCARDGASRRTTPA